MDKRNCIHRQELLPKIKDRNKLRKFRKKTAKCTVLWKCICGKGPRRPSTIQTKENHHAHASTQWQKACPVLRAKRIFVQSLHCLHMTGLCLQMCIRDRRIIAGLETPDEGRVILNGQDVTDSEPNKRCLLYTSELLQRKPGMQLHHLGLDERHGGRAAADAEQPELKKAPEQFQMDH